jgi:hypothetical protein
MSLLSELVDPKITLVFVWHWDWVVYRCRWWGVAVVVVAYLRLQCYNDLILNRELAT